MVFNINNFEEVKFEKNINRDAMYCIQCAEKPEIFHSHENVYLMTKEEYEKYKIIRGKRLYE